jgi:class 3 adenylate cyclase
MSCRHPNLPAFVTARHGAAPFLASDVQKLRLATACEQAGLPMELSARLDPELAPLLDRAVMAIYHRQQELAWIEDQVEHVEAALGEVGARARPERVPAMCFLDLAGYTRLTEERGDQAAAALVESLAVLVRRLAREHGGVPAKWLGDGVMFYV